MPYIDWDTIRRTGDLLESKDVVIGELEEELEAALEENAALRAALMIEKATE